MKQLEVRIPHRLDPAEVRSRLDEALVRAHDEYAGRVRSIESSWQDDGRLAVSLDVLGTAIDCTVEILPGELMVLLEVPGLAGLLAGRITRGIEERLGGLLAPPS